MVDTSNQNQSQSQSVEAEADSPSIQNRTFQFAVRIVKLSDMLDSRPGTARTLARQLLRAGTSIGANVEEAQAAHSRPDFIAKMTIALKEARETCYWLRLLAAIELVPTSRLTELLDESERVTRIIARIVISTRQKNK